jgi:hypothetical protein
LERYTIVRRHRGPGTKPVLYAAADDCEAMIGQKNRLFDALANQTDAGVNVVNIGLNEAGMRLEQTAEFHRVMCGAMDNTLSRWKQMRRPPNA